MSETEGCSAGPEPAAAGGAPSIVWVRDFVRRWLGAWNSHQVDQVLGLLTEDVEIRDDSWPKTMHGHGDVREYVEALWRASPDLTYELLGGPYLIPGEPRAAYQWCGSRTFTAAMDPPGFAPTGGRWEIEGGDFHEYRDGLLARLRVTFDG